MTSRERILGRVREALRIAAPRPGAHGPAGHGSGAPPVPQGAARAWLPPGGDTPEERMQRFKAASAELRTEFHWLENVDEGHALLLRLAADSGWRRIAAHRGALTSPAADALGLPVLWVDDGFDPRDMEPCDAGLTECEALVAQTGSVISSSRPGGRAISALPPHHVVLARRAQLVGDLADAFELLETRRGGAWPGMISFITGPSRTGDIERILVLGAHGPKRLTVIVF